MDLKLVIAELRAELESIDHVTAALERLAELRSLRSTTLTNSEAKLEPPAARRTRTRKPALPKESVASSSSD